MKEYIFENNRDNRIKISIEASNYTEAMELLLSITRYIEDFTLIEK